MPSPSPATAPERRGLLRTLGLHRRELRAWAMYDWAISAFSTTVAVAVFPIFFIRVAGDGDAVVAGQWWGYANSLAIAIVALLAPVLGAVADFSAGKKRFLGMFTGLGVAAVAGMWFIHQGDLLLAAALYLVASVAAAGCAVFYEALLPHIADEREVDRVSTAGYALGYVGGGVLLAFNLAWIQNPGMFGLPGGTVPARLSFVSVAVWWLVFSFPLFRRVPEPPRALEPDEKPTASPVRVAFSRLYETFHELRGYRSAFLFLLAFLLYNDGIATIQKMAAVYATELGIPEATTILAILVVQFVGIPFSFGFGALAGRIGAKRSILAGLCVYGVISVFGFFIATLEQEARATAFLVLALMVGMVQGGTQALSRSLFSTMIPRHKSGEFFGFYSVFSKFAGIFGPLLFAAMIHQTGSGRYGILSVIAFFLVGGSILLFVDTEAGERAAREAEAAVRIVPADEPVSAA